MTIDESYIITPENIAAWVIKNRFRKGNAPIMTDKELYDSLLDMINVLQGDRDELKKSLTLDLLTQPF